MKQHRKTFKQLTETIQVKKNALWQEACDDGTQEYILLNESDNKDPRQTQRIYDRALVENDAKHFVEVFKVEPEFMTREELDRWEAFSKLQKPKSRRIKADPKLVVEVERVYGGRGAKGIGVSDTRLREVATVVKGSRTNAIAARKLKLSVSTIGVYKAEAKKRGLL